MPIKRKTSKSKSKLLFEENRKLHQHAFKWGNALYAISSKKNSKKNTTKKSPKEDINEALDEYVHPNLQARVNISEHFPVVLTALDGNEQERYAVTWHNKNLQDWRTERAESWDEYMDYEAWVETRLIYSLNQYPQLYKVEPPRSDDQLCVISMLQRNNTRKAPRVSRWNKPAATPVPKLRFLNDIKAHFPVVWPHAGKIVKGDIIRLEFHRKNLKTQALEANVPLDRYQSQVEERLLSALRASDSWEVLSPEDKTSICRLRIRM